MLKNDRDKSRKIQAKEKDIPRKLSYFDEFIGHMKSIILQGTDKYTGAEKDKAETIDIMPQVVGEDGYVSFIICDILKRLIRFKNDRRERDIIKIAVWCYLLLKFYKDKDEKIKNSE